MTACSSTHTVAQYAHHVLSCSATKEATTSLNEPMRPTLDEALEYVVDDELVEVRVSSSLPPSPYQQL